MFTITILIVCFIADFVYFFLVDLLPFSYFMITLRVINFMFFFKKFGNCLESDAMFFNKFLMIHKLAFVVKFIDFIYIFCNLFGTTSGPTAFPLTIVLNFTFKFSINYGHHIGSH